MGKKNFIFASVITILSFVSAIDISAQAEAFFDRVSARFGSIRDYQAHIRITYANSDNVMEGTIYYKSPNLLRINFTKPRGQVLAVDGNELIFFIPSHSVIMVQKLSHHTESAIISMTHAQGLHLLKGIKPITYASGSDPVPLEGTSELVTKLRFGGRVEVSIGKDLFIRRIEFSGSGITYDYSNITINQGIPDAQFKYDLPPTANVISNFLYDPEG